MGGGAWSDDPEKVAGNGAGEEKSFLDRAWVLTVIRGSDYSFGRLEALEPSCIVRDRVDW